MKPVVLTPNAFLHPVLLVVAALAAIALTFAPRVAAQETGPSVVPSPDVAPQPDIWDIARGGQLYDSWPAALDTEPPDGTHPAYTVIGRKKGKITWRCKECHGWDYKGEDGVYGKGAHYTGIQGVRRVAGMDPEKIIELFTDQTHGYTTDMMPPLAMRKLALFLSKGQLNMDQYIDRATKEAHGFTKRGAAFFQTICAICHGFDGAQMVSKSQTTLAAFGDRGFLGSIAATNPWEVLHKIRNGHPGVGMVPLRVLGVQDQVDVLAYMQSLIRRPYRK